MSLISSIKPPATSLRRFAAVVAALAGLLVVVPAQPASAAASITGPGNLVCERYDNKLSVSPPRVWASYRTEQVLWDATVQRWDGSRWVKYSHHEFWGSFNIYGQNVAGWSTGWYTRNTMNIPVYHRGYYRVASFVGGTQGGVTWAGYVDRGSHCRVY